MEGGANPPLVVGAACAEKREGGERLIFNWKRQIRIGKCGLHAKKSYRGDMRWQLCCTRRGNHIRVPISFLLSPPFYPEGDIALYTRAGLENKTRSRRRRAALPGLTHKAPCAVPRMIMAIFIKRGEGGGAKLRKWSELNASMYAIVITFFLYRQKSTFGVFFLEFENVSPLCCVHKLRVNRQKFLNEPWCMFRRPGLENEVGTARALTSIYCKLHPPQPLACTQPPNHPQVPKKTASSTS